MGFGKIVLVVNDLFDSLKKRALMEKTQTVKKKVRCHL